MHTTTHKPAKITVRVASAFDRFTSNESAGGLLLIACTVAALIWANSPWAQSYFDLWHMKAGFSFGDFTLKKSLHHWINDGLMVLFFFLVGLEIKREVLIGELNTFKKAMLPMSAALGGMVAPALLYFVLNQSGASAAGWGIPMATDIAFALAVMALLGRRVPLALKIFLTALAIVDDLGAVLVIALFYTEQLNVIALVIGGALLLAAFALNWLGVQRPTPYVIIGLLLWFAVFQSGVHATVAGVLLALAIPAKPRIRSKDFILKLRALISDFGKQTGVDKDVESKDVDAQSALDTVHSLKKSCVEVEPPLERLEHALAPWIAFAIVPLFALANAGVSLGGGFGTALGSSVALGIILGLLAGKIIGISLFSWIAVKLKLADLPAGVTWVHIIGTSLLCGIGFTMSLFIANLAFGTGELLDQAKIGILSASLVAGVAGYLILARIGKAPSAEAS